jgi:Xaa-Pro aminopeptidase
MNYLLKDENSIYYECGYSSDNAIFVRLGSESFFITDGRYELDAKLGCQSGVEIIIDRDLINTVKRLLISNNIKKVTIDPKEFSILDYNELSCGLNVEFEYDKSFSQKKRIVKTSKEIELLNSAAKFGAQAFDNFMQALYPDMLGCDEFRLTHFARECLSFQGRYELSFSPIVAINSNAAKPHATPTDMKLNKNDLLLIDVGLKFERYCSDRTRTISINDGINCSLLQHFDSEEKQKIYDIVLKAHNSAIMKAKSGMKASEIDKIARDIIYDSGFGDYFVHSTGHGVGLDIHELPVISAKSETIIEDGMVFTIEPGIYLPNEFGVRIEDTVVMRNGRAEILGV